MKRHRTQRHVENESLRFLLPVVSFILLACVPEVSFADHYGICEPPDCEAGAGGVLGGLVGLILLIALATQLNKVQNITFFLIWLGGVVGSFALGYKGFAAFWGTVGFFISMFITWWVSDWFETSNGQPTKPSTQPPPEAETPAATTPWHRDTSNLPEFLRKDDADPPADDPYEYVQEQADEVMFNVNVMLKSIKLRGWDVEHDGTKWTLTKGKRVYYAYSPPDIGRFWVDHRDDPVVSKPNLSAGGESPQFVSRTPGRHLAKMAEHFREQDALPQQVSKMPGSHLQGLGQILAMPDSPSSTSTLPKSPRTLADAMKKTEEIRNSPEGKARSARRAAYVAEMEKAKQENQNPKIQEMLEKLEQKVAPLRGQPEFEAKVEKALQLLSKRKAEPPDD